MLCCENRKYLETALGSDQPPARMIAGLSVLVATVLFYAITNFDIGGGDGFYAYITHSVLVVIFAPVFVLPLFALGISLRSY